MSYRTLKNYWCTSYENYEPQFEEPKKFLYY